MAGPEPAIHLAGGTMDGRLEAGHDTVMMAWRGLEVAGPAMT